MAHHNEEHESNTIQHGSKVRMIAYAEDLAIHGGPIGDDILYKQITTALKKIETKAM